MSTTTVLPTRYEVEYDRVTATALRVFREFLGIQRNGLLRLHAKCRESAVIESELERRGLCIVLSDDPKMDGWRYALAIIREIGHIYNNGDAEILCVDSEATRT